MVALLNNGFKGYGRKRSWPIVTYNPGIFLEIQESHGKSVGVAGFWAEI
jgi:hypothetical protein